MPINKVDRKELKEMLVSILSKSATFKMLSNDNEVNPCRISFDGMEFYIYIKNLSPAQLSNNNPDIWRIQLATRDVFTPVKQADIPFVILGYDDENQIYTTWNPYQVKQRLNQVNNVSLYSRFSLQCKANETQQFQNQNLNNDGEVVAFPISKLGYYLINIQQFFPEMTDYVAMGSRKRTEANAAYRCLCDSKNIADYAHYLHVMKGLQKPTINNYCHAIKRLISEGYFSRNRKIFLACDSLTEYPNVIKIFIAVPEVAELNNVWHNTFSASLKAYIQYLLEINNLSGDDDETPVEDSTDIDPSSEPTTPAIEPTTDNVDYEAMFTDANGKLTRIANPKLIDKLRPVLDTEYRKTAVAYNIITEFYGDRFNTMELKDWNSLFNQIDWSSPYVQLTQQQPEKSQKHKSHILKVTTPDGQIFQNKIVAETLVQVIKYAGVERVHDMKINVCAANMIIREDEINPRYAAATKYIDNDLYANTCCDTPTKAGIIKQISDTLQLGLTVDFVSIDGSNTELSPTSSSSNRKKIKVTFPDGKEICCAVVSDTFVEVVKYVGADNVRNLGINIAGDNLIVDKEHINPKYEISTKQIDHKWYCFTNISTAKKAEILNQISETLNLNLKIEIN